MAAYFDGSSDFQAAGSSSDGMQTLFLMNPNYMVPYSHHSNQPPAAAAAATNMFFFNPAAGNALNTPPATSSHHHLLGLPLPTPSDSNDPHRPQSLHGIVPPGTVQYNMWGAGGSSSNIDHHHVHDHVSVAAEEKSGGTHDVAAASQLVGLRRAPVVSPRQCLSLGLSSQILRVPYRSSNVETVSVTVADDMRMSGNSPSSITVVSNGVNPSGVVLRSKYLRAAQELLDEVVDVGKLGIKISSDVSEPEGTKQQQQEKIKMNKESVATAVTEERENGAKRGAELTTVQKQELQMKKAKLVTMLDEVEQRYRQYHQQMQIVISSFEQAAGSGAAKSYTCLALKTISKQFRCIKDAISGQIKGTSKSLGEEDCLGAKVEGSRLRYVDHQLRQQRALQQLGMAPHHNAWRPQRGLPERAVSVLRAWLFEHFLHPYPKDSDKHMLAKQTGLTRSQVSNWFINARVRLWKPMVEEMYLEEVKEHERNCSEEINANNREEQKELRSTSTAQQESHVSLKMDHQVNKSSLTNSKPAPDKSINQQNTNYSKSTISTSLMRGSLLPQTAAFNLIESSSSSDQLDDIHGAAAQRSPKKPRNNINDSILDMEMKQGNQINMNFGAFGNYSSAMGEIGRFHGNSISLTLGLTQQQNFIPNNHNFDDQLERSSSRLELAPRETDFCQQAGAASHDHSTTAGYNDYYIEMQNRKRFAVQLLPEEN